MTARPRTPVLLLLLAAAPLPGQDAAALAQELVQALAPERDDPDAAVRRLLAAALATPRSPAASLLAGEARSRLDDVADPAGLQRWLQQAATDEPRHGLLAQRLREVAWLLWRRAGGAAPPDPYRDYMRAVQVIGPFGDAGSHWLDVPLPPDDGFPEGGARLAGRFGEVAVRVVERRPDRHSLPLLEPRQPRRGACFVLWRVHVAAATAGFLEVEYPGALLVRVDGFEVGRADPHMRPGPAVHRFAVRLAAGERRIVLKTGDTSDRPVAGRLLDGDGAPLPGVTELAPDAPAGESTAPDPRDPATFRDGLSTFEQAAAQQGGDARIVRVAAAWAAQRTGEVDRALAHALALLEEPPADPAARLVLADVVQRLQALPEEQRRAHAQTLEEGAFAALPPDHHQAALCRVRQLEDQDQREAALRLLRAAAAADRAGPATFAVMHGLLRRLRFLAEVPDLLRSWAQRCPGDARPRTLLAEHLLGLGNAAAALAQARAALALQPFDEAVQRQAFRLALDLGEFAVAREIVDLAHPERDPPTLARVTALVTIGARAGDDGMLRAALAAVAAHPDADAATCRRLGERWLQLGEPAAALAACEQSLQLDPDQPAVAELAARLRGGTAPGAALAGFRRDGDAAIAAFRPGPEEAAASTSMLIDQRLVEVQPDGATLTEVHELRRINDLQGVEALRVAEDPARADELLLLRTVGADGRSWVPARVEQGFAMPRLEPGAFVEWRYRMRTRAAGAEPLQVEPFLFASHQEPLHLTEYVVIPPPDARGELRRRNLGEATAVPLDDGRTALVLCRQDVPRLPEENAPPPAEELIPMAGWGEDASPWPALRAVRASTLLRTRPTAPIERFARQLLEGAAGDGERLQRIAAFCDREIGDGTGGDATEVLLRKKGSRFLLAVALLRAADVPLRTAACAAQRDAGGAPLFQPPEPATLPAVLVEPQGGAPVWLFADAPRHLPPGTIPAQRGAELAFVIGDGTVEQVRLPAAAGAEQDGRVEGTCTVDGEANVLRGRAVIGDVAGYGLAEQLRRRTADVRALAARQISQQLFPGWRVRRADAGDLEPPGRPVAIEFELQDAGPQQVDEHRWLLPLPLPASDLRQSFADREQRTLPLHLQQDIDMRFSIALDPGGQLTVAEPPPPVLVSFGPLDYQLTFARDGRRLRIDRRVRLRPATLPVALYPDWVRTLTTIDRAEQRGLVLVRRP